MLRVALVLRSTEVMPVFSCFVSIICLKSGVAYAFGAASVALLPDSVLPPMKIPNRDPRRDIPRERSRIEIPERYPQREIPSRFKS